MRRLIIAVLGAALLFPAAACSGTESGTPGPATGGGPGAGADDSDNGNGEDGDNGNGTDDTGGVAPKCPLTVAQVSEILGQSMVDKGSCSFGDGNGVALLTITMASQLAGEATYEFQRDQATQLYREVQDLDKGEKAYLAVKDIAAEAVVISRTGSYTVTLSSFQRLGSQPDGYQRALRDLLDAFPL